MHVKYDGNYSNLKYQEPNRNQLLGLSEFEIARNGWKGQIMRHVRMDDHGCTLADDVIVTTSSPRKSNAKIYFSYYLLVNLC